MRKQTGFTLLELMIAVAIVGILASLAYPSYIEQIRESKRTDAKAALYRIAQQQEEYYIQKMSYAANITKLYDPDSASNTLSATTTINSSNSEYSIAITTVQPNNCVSDSTNSCISYVVSATAQNGQVHDKECSIMRVNNLGQELSEDDGGNDTSATCW